MADDLDMRDIEQRTAAATDSGDARVVTARRRLMLGAAAVLPSVVSLRSGAQAASQSFNCVQRAGKTSAMLNSAEVQRFTDATDGWLRKRVFSGQFKRAGTRAYCTTWDQPSVLAIAEPDMAVKDGGYRALLGTRWSDGQDSVQINALCTTSSGPSQLAGAAAYCYDESVEKIGAAPNYYALVYVDETGLSCSLEPGPGLSPVQETCWASLVGSSGSSLG